jgi:hypothetical protein
MAAIVFPVRSNPDGEDFFRLFLKNSRSREFLLSGDEIKSTGKMKKGTVPVPPYCFCDECDDDVSPVQGVSHFGGSRSDGGEILVKHSVFFEQFTDTIFKKKILQLRAVLSIEGH